MTHDTTEVALVTGASSGIGRATALALAQRGAAVVLLSRSKETLEETAEECLAAGARAAEVAVVDVNDRAGVTAAVQGAVRRFGHLDLVVHSATVMAYGTIEDLPPEVFEKVVETAVHGTANVARPALAAFRARGRGDLVVVSSLLASVTAPSMGAYSTAKWGQLALVRTLQQETRDVPGVHVSAVAPGGVNTPIYRQAATVLGNTGHPPPPAYTPERIARSVLARVPHPRRLKQAGIANPLVIAGFRLLPPVYDALVGPLLRTFGMARDHVAATDGNVFAPVPGGERTSGPWRAF